MRQTAAPWTTTRCSTACGGSSSRPRPGATATRARASTSIPWPGAARDVRERIDDAALVHGLTGCCPSVALHIPWDARRRLTASSRRYAEGAGIRIGAINPNLFGDDAYRLGSLCHPDAAVRAKALEHCRECVEIAH